MAIRGAGRFAGPQLRPDAELGDEVAGFGRVGLDALGQAFGRGAHHLPALLKQFLSHLGRARDLAEQRGQSGRHRLGQGVRRSDGGQRLG